MKPEHSGTFRAKMVAKNILLGSPGTLFMHMTVKYFETKGLKKLDNKMFELYQVFMC